MAFFVNLGWTINLPEEIIPDGGIFLASKIAKHTLERRKISKIEWLNCHFFDPQLYLATINAYECRDDCIKLSSYPWFGARNVQEYDSKEINQKEWKERATKTIFESWLGKIPTDPLLVSKLVGECIDFQCSIDCTGIIIPSPLTFDYSTDYSSELMWLDFGLKYISSKKISKPIYATIAISDICLRYEDPVNNQLLQMIFDSISSREVDGVYFLVEQKDERQDTRYITNSRTLEAALYLTHVFSNICNLDVIANFFGPFGLALEAVGANAWASNWYKSLVRFRLGDMPKPPTAYAWPIYWSFPLAAEINLDSELDIICSTGNLDLIKDITPFSESLFRGLSSGANVAQIIDWRYSKSNVTSTICHYLYSAINADRLLSTHSNKERLDFIEKWLSDATKRVEIIEEILPKQPKTKLDHVYAWRDAFINFRRTHNV